MKQKRRNPIWYIACPLVIYLAISFFVQMAAQFVYTILNIPRISDINDYEELWEVAYTIAAEILQYTTEITAVTALAMLPIAIWMFLKDRKEDVTLGKVQTRKLPIGNYGVLIILGIAVCIGANNLITLSSISSLSAYYETTIDYLYSSSFPVQLICIGIIIPISEEFIMRGLVYKRMCNLMTQRRAMLWSALIFGIMHGNLVQFIYAAGLGVLLAYIYESYGSLKAPAFAHIVLNLTSVFATQFDVFTWIFYSPLRMAVVTILCAAVGAGMFVVIQRMKTTILQDLI